MRVCKFFLFCVFLSVCGYDPEIVSSLRDPFSLKITKTGISLVSVLSEPGKKLAIVEYNNESVLVSTGDVIGSKWKVINIEDKEIGLENIKTQEKKMVLLNDD